ncbi:MAG TPA: DUF1080 domain-containing protein, partial [Verrucomicrobiae bacterium]|nr:DUF1080 domain-containing protein [Verrucomicrobiae bacterium]
MQTVILLVFVLAATPFASLAEAPFPPPARLAAAINAGRSTEVTVQGDEGCSYIVESGSALGRWAPSITNSIVNGSFSYSPPSLSSASFFRALALLSIRPEGAVWLFDGRSFAGWNGDTADTAAVFHVESYAINGGNLSNAIPQSQFLCTDRAFTNFVLRLKCKLVGVPGTFINSGVQFRSQRVPNSSEVAGFQADMGEGYWGSLYDEARRNAVLAAADPALIAQVLRPNDWNEYT